jgi:hypothetical protein
MAMTISRLPEQPARLAPVEAHYAPLFCFGLLTIASGLASFAFACATPFAAYAVIAAAMLPLRPALLVVFASWLVNQAIGFGCLHYPIDANTIAWGLVMGAAAALATVAAFATLHSTKAATVFALAAAFVAGYAAYELLLFAATRFLGSADDFTVSILGYLGLLNALWTVGLAAVCEIARLSRRLLSSHRPV